MTEGLDLSGQTWLVTGTNSGLGYETIRVLALRGANIIAAARTKEKAQQAMDELGIDGTPLACELSDLSSVRAAVGKVSSLGVSLSGIIANAGIMALPSLQQVNGIEKQFFTNHVGHFVLITGLCEKHLQMMDVLLFCPVVHTFMLQILGWSLIIFQGNVIMMTGVCMVDQSLPILCLPLH